MDNLGKISAFGKSFGYVAEAFHDVLSQHCATTDRLTWCPQRFFHALRCQDTAVRQGAAWSGRGQGAITPKRCLQQLYPSLQAPPQRMFGLALTGCMTDPASSGLYRAREARRCAEKGAHDHAPGHLAILQRSLRLPCEPP